MITMDQYEYIRIAHRVYDKGIRQIQRETGHDRKTIRKALREEESFWLFKEGSPACSDNWTIPGDHPGMACG